jgi:nucleotide-binding universal stress UspA family protein
MTVSYQRILVPLDGSSHAAVALDHAETLAALAHARLYLVNVLPSTAMLVSETAVATPGMGMPTIDPYLSTSQFDAVENSLEAEAAKTLTEAAALLMAKSIEVKTVVLKGAPADAILAFAKQEAIDLIVMSTHGRTGFLRLVYGSVAESVLHHSPCPVLLVRVSGE